MRSSEVRRKFLAYFEARGHTIVPSASLIPAGDPTLLFVNAGMVPFKDVFLGKERRPYTRAASVQKCLRVSGKHNDLEEVGPSSHHHTFFEMLGNFSFGDYFKEEALAYTWEFLTKEMGLPGDKLHPTVYEEDDESAAIWAKLKGIPSSQVVRLGADDNFWSMGDTGPCGPNSEVMYDRTGACLNDGSDCPLTCECDRWWEIWNNVFMQFDRAADGTLSPLPKSGVDTGMGFERLCAVLQGAESDYETDVFAPLIDRLRALTGESQAITPERLGSYRAVADHARSIAFLIADGLMPSNEGRGYVLRRILRRASYHGRLLGLTRPFLTEVCAAVIDTMGEAYPELTEASSRITDLVSDEEERFLATLEAGLTRLERTIEESPAATTVLPGDEAFRLYDTFGFPIDLTRNVLAARNWRVDEDGFERALEAQRERARAALHEERGEEGALLESLRDLAWTQFAGYDTMSSEATVLALLRDAARVASAAEGDTVDLVLDATPFYAEGGGQVGDSGRITGPDGQVEVETVRRVGAVFVHAGRVVRGRIAEGDRVRAEVDESSRRATMRNHTATHLLHKALRVVLGPQAKQAGSLVAPDRLRFDFLHGKPLSEDELRRAERIVQEQVLLDKPVTTDLMNIQEALSLGADAMFDEKYGEDVRVVSVNGGEVFSRELCGGTHCHRTGEIGAFFIVEQRSVGAGVRRVEAVTGFNAIEWMNARRQVVDELSREYNVPPAELPERLRALAERAKATRAVSHTTDAVLVDRVTEILARAEQVDGRLVITERVPAADPTELRDFGDALRRKAKGSAALALGALFEDRPAIVVMLSPDLVQVGLDAAKLAKQIGNAMGGGGGGRPDLAEAGGRDPAKLDDALALAKTLLRGEG
ncbi:MAG: alanine--tRNA ligase [Dehalococcoidia bacterium]